MADAKISALDNLTSADPANDMIPIVDVSATPPASGNTKRISINNILACSPTATLASATITGAATAASLTVTGSSIPTNGLYLPTTNTLEFAANSLAQYRIAPLGVFTWYDGAGGTRMTLNSTGLGIGVVPSTYKLEVGNGSVDARALFKSNNAFSIGVQNGASGIGGWIGSTGNNILTFSGNDGTMKVTISDTGNVGVGVTPSARFHSKAGAVTLGGIIETGGANALLSFADSATSSYTRVQIGSSGNNLVALINGSTALTLNSSNSLVLGSAAIATTATDGFLYIPGCAGTPIGTPTAQTGRVPLVVDTTNNKLYFYSGGSWVAAN